MNISGHFVKSGSLTSYQRFSIATALQAMGMKNIRATDIVHLLLHNQEDNYYEVLTAGGGSFYVHRPSLKRALAKVRAYSAA